MKYAKRILMVAGALALAGLLAVAIAPKAAHAVVASMVQVVNTAASPAITQDTSKQAAQIVSLLCQESPSLCLQILEGGGVASGAYSVTTGSHLVVTSADVFVNTPFTAPGTQMFLQNTATGNAYEFFNIPEGSAGAQFNFGSGFAVAPGTGLSIGEAYLSSAGSVVFYVHGYLTAN